MTPTVMMQCSSSSSSSSSLVGTCIVVRNKAWNRIIWVYTRKGWGRSEFIQILLYSFLYVFTILQNKVLRSSFIPETFYSYTNVHFLSYQKPNASPCMQLLSEASKCRVNTIITDVHGNCNRNYLLRVVLQPPKYTRKRLNRNYICRVT